MDGNATIDEKINSEGRLRSYPRFPSKGDAKHDAKLSSNTASKLQDLQSSHVEVDDNVAELQQKEKEETSH